MHLNSVIARSDGMSTASFDIEAELRRLEQKIDLLNQLCQQLRQENQELKAQQIEWNKERSELTEKSTLAKSRVQAMLTRIKSMGHES